MSRKTLVVTKYFDIICNVPVVLSDCVHCGGIDIDVVTHNGLIQGVLCQTCKSTSPTTSVWNNRI